MNDWQRLDELLERGLDFYGRQLVVEAIRCWREVLQLSPGHRLALEYLEAAGASAQDGQDGQGGQGGADGADSRPTTPPRVTRSSSTRGSTQDDRGVSIGRATTSDEQVMSLDSLSALTVELIREKRFEEALTLLYTAHGEAPRDQSISRSINVVKQRLLREYRAEIGDLSQVPKLALDDALIEELPLSDDERELVPLIDGLEIENDESGYVCGLIFEHWNFTSEHNFLSAASFFTAGTLAAATVFSMMATSTDTWFWRGFAIGLPRRRNHDDEEHRDQGRNAAESAGLVRLAGPLHGLPETSLEKQPNGILNHQTGALALAPLAILLGPPGQAEGQRQRPQRRIEDKNEGNQRQNEKVQADFSAIRRKDEQDIAVVDPRAEGDGNRQPEQGEDPEQALHFFSLPLRRTRSAVWVSFRLGNAMTISVARSWRSVACAA